MSMARSDASLVEGLPRDRSGEALRELYLPTIA
jgi:hypothetical protein